MRLNLTSAGFLTLVMAAPSMAGPPIMCQALDIAKARSLPMGSGAMETSSGCSKSAAIEEAIAILKGDAAPLVRMETLRRATVYVTKDEAKAKELFSRVMALHLDAAAAKTDVQARNALFDAGFLAACYAEMGLDLGWKPGMAEGVQGYGWIKSAIESLPKDAHERAEMEFGAALAVHPADHRSPEARTLYDGHLARAAEGARADALLDENLKSHHARWESYLDKPSK